jgi:hypothetical protein
MRLRFALLLLTALPASAETRLALGAGEAFTYKVSWAVLPGAGEIKIVANADSSGPTPRLRVTTTTATRGLARWLLRFDAMGESLFDLPTGRLLSLDESSQQGEKHASQRVTFDYAAARALHSSPDADDQQPPFAIPAGDPMDLITSLIQTRSWELKSGETRDALVLFEDEFYELTVHAARTEVVATPLGSFHTLVLEPRMDKTPPKGMFKKGSTVRVWIEQDDARRLPVKFEVQFKIGTGVATLVGYQPPAPPAAAPGLPAVVSGAAKLADDKRADPNAKDTRP